jgi:4-amino-4-deoxy-L-arabinose transferase-like glycosyltransferase
VDRDEPRFAEASREMRERGDYVIPYFNDNYRFDKPAFIYWTQIASYSFFGENDFAARFPSTVAAALTAVLLFAWGRRLGSERIGWWAAIIFTLCFQVFIHAKAAVADMWLVFFVTVASWAGFELLADSLGRAPDPEFETAHPRAVGDQRHLKYWRLVFYIALGFGFLAKGPLAWLPLLTVLSSKFFVRDISLTRRFWFFTGMLGAFAIICTWGIPALIRTNGEFFAVGIGRHVVERSFGPLEGHGAQSLRSYLLTLPFYFGTVFLSFFPWSIKLPALTWRLWRKRDGIDNYLLSGILIVFVIMSLVKTKLPHYTLTAFPLLSLLLARHLFELRSFFAQLLRIVFPSFRLTRWFLERPPSRRFGFRTAVIAVAVSLSTSLILFPWGARTFPSAELFKKSQNDLLPEMDFANVGYFEPSVVWYFRSRVHGFFRGLDPDKVEKFMKFPGPRFVILPTELATTIYPRIPDGWKSYRTKGFNFVKGKRTDLTLVLKQSQ